MTDESRYPVPDLPPGGRFQSEETIRRSRFIATAARASTPEEAKAFIDEIRAEHSQATHNCWAYAAGAPGDTARVGASDDGEPKGTAGRPMLTAILHGGVGETVVVVTRYFGGILLGTGGLVRAYQGTTKAVLEALPTKPREVFVRYVASLDPTISANFEHVLREAGGKVLSTDFRFDAAYEILVPEDAAVRFESLVHSISGGEALLDRQEEFAS